MKARVAEVSAPQHVLHDAQDHSDAGRRKPGVPVDPLAEISAHERRDERPQVDPHVENREPRVATLIVRPVQPADDHADIAF